MNKNTASGLLYSVTDSDFFESLHVGGGMLLVLLAAVHLMPFSTTKADRQRHHLEVETSHYLPAVPPLYL